MSLTANDVSIAFGGIQALAQASVSVESGQVVALIGPNGAGKTTLFNCISGILRPTEGEILLDGTPITTRSVISRVRCGIARTFQTPKFDPTSTVLANVMAGGYAHTRSRLTGTLLRLPRQQKERRSLRAAALERLALTGLDDAAGVPASQLPLGSLRMMEVARALMSDPKYVLLDEPAAGLDQEGRRHLGDALHLLRGHGAGVLIVEHNFEFVSTISDRIYVLARGSVLVDGTPAEISASARVRATYLGEETTDAR